MSLQPNVLRLIVVAVSVVLAVSDARAAGGARIAIAGIRKDTGIVSKQLTSTLCGRFECVPAARVKRGTAINFAAARAANVSGILFGTIATVRGKKRLQLALLVSSLKPRQRWVLPLQGGRLSHRDLERVASELETQFAPAERAEPPPPKYEPAPKYTPPPVAAAPEPAPLGEPPVAEETAAAEAAPGEVPEPSASAAADTSAPEPASYSAPRTSRPSGSRGTSSRISEPTTEAGPRARRVALDVGIDMTQRKLSYSGVSAASGTLQTFTVGGIVSPAVRVEVSPWGGSPESVIAGLTVFGGYARSLGLTAEAASEPGVKHNTVLQRIDVGAGWRIHPFTGSGFSLMPRVAWRMLSLRVGATNGALIAGLPDANLSGPSVGLDLEVPFAGRFAVLGGVGYTKWMQAKDLVGTGTGFFPSGSASALDASVGLSVDVAGPVSIRVLGDFSNTSYTLSGASSYTASGATDRYLGGRVMVRLAL